MRTLTPRYSDYAIQPMLNRMNELLELHKKVSELSDDPDAELKKAMISWYDDSRCQISRCVFRYPVVLSNGEIYEASMILKWFQNQIRPSSPVSRQVITSAHLNILTLNTLEKISPFASEVDDREESYDIKPVMDSLQNVFTNPTKKRNQDTLLYYIAMASSILGATLLIWVVNIYSPDEERELNNIHLKVCLGLIVLAIVSNTMRNFLPSSHEPNNNDQVAPANPPEFIHAEAARLG